MTVILILTQLLFKVTLVYVSFVTGLAHCEFLLYIIILLVQK